MTLADRLLWALTKTCWGTAAAAVALDAYLLTMPRFIP